MMKSRFQAIGSVLNGCHHRPVDRHRIDRDMRRPQKATTGLVAN